jgi:hypothetical protein
MMVSPLAMLACSIDSRLGIGFEPGWSAGSLVLKACSVKVTGLAQKLGELEAVHMDFQPKYWANLKLLGQPINFYACADRAETSYTF